jgi:hypothetical protein
MYYRQGSTRSPLLDLIHRLAERNLDSADSHRRLNGEQAHNRGRLCRAAAVGVCRAVWLMLRAPAGRGEGFQVFSAAFFRYSR